MRAKQIHLEELVIEILTIQAVKEKTTFKEYVQSILTEKAQSININQLQTQALDKCVAENLKKDGKDNI